MFDSNNESNANVLALVLRFFLKFFYFAEISA